MITSASSDAGPQRQISPDKLCICVLTHNRLPRLQATLANLLFHIGKEARIYIVDNGSIDGTKEYLHDICQAHANVSVLCSPVNLGVCRGRNKMWETSEAEFILSIDDDIELTRHDMLALVEHLNSEDCVGIVSPNIKDSESGRILNPPTGRRRLPTFFEACFALKRSVLRDVGGFDECLQYAGEGLDYALRLLAAGYVVKRACDVTAVHFDRPRTVTEVIERRQSWLYSMSYVYWKNLPAGRASYWTLRNLIAHARTGLPLFGLMGCARLPAVAFRGARFGWERKMLNGKANSHKRSGEEYC